MKQNEQTTAPERQLRMDTDGVAIQSKVTELSQEIKTIDAQIGDLEVRAAQESDEQRVVDLLTERSRLEQRKQALPFILRGVQARALYAQGAALHEEAAAVKVELAAAESAVESATALVPELERRLQEATEAVTKAQQRRDALDQQYRDLEKGASYAEADARCIERGEPMKFIPTRFIGVVEE